MENSVASEAGKVSVTDLVQMFESFEEASYEARKQAERDRDYHDNIQLTAEEKKTLRRRGQPEYIDNRIKTKVDYLVGLEKQQRVNPRALPRTPLHDDDADSASQALNYVADKENFDYKRSAVWRNLLIEGAGGMGVTVKQAGNEMEICLKRVPWDRMFWDPHSAEVDFSDAQYLGTVQWMDYNDALAMYPDGQDELDATLSGVSVADTFDDKPRFNVWADKKRKRVRIVAIWVKRGDDWHFAEFTKGGILKAGPSPYRDDKGNSDCELIFQSAYVDRENNRFGLVREMITVQDGINKTHSKAQHLLNVAQIVMTRDAVEDGDIEKVRREAAKPDGVIILNPTTNGAIDQKFQFNTRTDLASSHLGMLQEAKNSIDLKGPNATAMGDKAQGSSAASGKAIVASQQGGMVSLGDLLDNLRHLDLRVFRAVWARIRQFWTAEKWIRVTDDDKTVKWVGLNVDPMRLQMASPKQQQKIAGVVGSVAELDCDIIIDESPLSPQTDQWESLVALKQAGVQIPDKALIRAMPNFSGKQQMLKEMDAPNPQAQITQQLQIGGAKAEVEKTMAETQKIVAETQQLGVGEDPRAPLIEAAARQQEAVAKQQEGQIRLTSILAKSEADQQQAALNAEGARLDNTGKEITNIGKLLDIQRQREAPQPSQVA